jgi:S1-C subfamily serine protease
LLLTLSACDTVTPPPQPTAQVAPTPAASGSTSSSTAGSTSSSASGTTTAPSTGPNIVAVAEKVRPATVLVQNLAVASRDPSQTSGAELVPRGLGTGFIYDPDGYIISNHHVVEGAVKLRVVLPPPDNRQFDARLLGSDAQTDLAVMKIEGQGLPTVALGSSDRLKVGDWVVAIGNALGLPGGPTVTAGVVSAVGREVQEPASESGAPGPTLYSLLQTDAAINPGNSGGPLVNLTGEVVGVNTIGAVEANTIGFAISIDAAKPIIDQLRQQGRVARGYLGIGVASLNEALRGALGLQQGNGVVITAVQPGSPAATAGLRQGDVIVRIGETTIEDRADLEYALSTQYKPGDTVPVTIVRDGRQQTVQVQLGDRPTAPQQAAPKPTAPRR